MKLLVGLGNPGREHVLNRHNLGFLAVESFVLAHGEDFRKEEFRSQTARLSIGGQDVLVMKPLTYMNRSGEAIAEAMKFYKVAIEDVIVAHDELDIPPCSFRIKRGGGHGGHNGLKSIITLGENFLRFRLGIGRPPHPEMQVPDFVLGNLSRADLDFWQKEMDQVHDGFELCLSGQEGQAMNRFNRKEKESHGS